MEVRQQRELPGRTGLSYFSVICPECPCAGWRAGVFLRLSRGRRTVAVLSLDRVGECGSGGPTSALAAQPSLPPFSLQGCLSPQLSQPQLPLSALTSSQKTQEILLKQKPYHEWYRKGSAPPGVRGRGLRVSLTQPPAISLFPWSGVEGNLSFQSTPHRPIASPVITHPPSPVQVPTLRCRSGEALPLSERPPEE